MKRLRPDADSARVMFPPPLVFVGFLLLGLLADRTAGWSIPVDREARLAAGILFLLAGGVFIVPSLAGFIRAGVDPEPWKAASKLVTTGLYRVTRNPMYLGMALAHIGFAMASGSPCAIAFVVPAVIAIDRCVITREERYLHNRFGAAYADYCRQVRRWI